jgi:hypothetical protein
MTAHDDGGSKASVSEDFEFQHDITRDSRLPGQRRIERPEKAHNDDVIFCGSYGRPSLRECSTERSEKQRKCEREPRDLLHFWNVPEAWAIRKLLSVQGMTECLTSSQLLQDPPTCHTRSRTNLGFLR